MSILAAIHPYDVNVALFVHVLGAMVLVGGLVTSGTALVIGWRDPAARLLRLGYFTLLAVVLPGYVLMRVGAEWTYVEEGWDDVDETPGWLDMGYIIADVTVPVLLITLILGGIGVRRLRTGGGASLLKLTTVLTLLLLAAYIVAVWAMSGKPD
jgi:hypothetical protein